MDREKLLKNKESIAKEYSKKQPKSKKLPRLTKQEKKILEIGKDEGKASLNNSRVSASKAKLVLDLIRNKSYEEAYAICKYTPRKASPVILKLLKSAQANAVNNNEMDGENLYVAQAYANQGPTMKRIRPRAQGRAFRIRKRTSHITIVLKERTE